MENKKLVLDVHEKPKMAQWLILSIQHVLAMFGATVLVPILTGLPISCALIGSGIGTLFYLFVTKGKSPVYLGSSLPLLLLSTNIDLQKFIQIPSVLEENLEEIIDINA